MDALLSPAAAAGAAAPSAEHALSRREGGILPRVQPSGAQSDEHLIALWLGGKRSPHTRAAYLGDIVAFWGFCLELPASADAGRPARPLGLRALTVAHVQAYAHALERRGAAPATVARRLSAVKSLLSYGHKTGYLPFNVGIVVQGPVLHSRLAERVLTEEEVARLFELAQGRDRTFLRYLYFSGARISEAVILERRDLVRRDDRLVVTLRGKGGRERLVPLPLHLGAELDALAEQGSDYLFRGQGGRPLTRAMGYRIVKRVARAAGCGHASPHSLRHSHASHAVRRRAPVHVVQQTLGHQSVATTGRYLHLERGESSAFYLPEFPAGAP